MEHPSQTLQSTQPPKKRPVKVTVPKQTHREDSTRLSERGRAKKPDIETHPKPKPVVHHPKVHKPEVHHPEMHHPEVHRAEVHDQGFDDFDDEYERRYNDMHDDQYYDENEYDDYGYENDYDYHNDYDYDDDYYNYAQDDTYNAAASSYQNDYYSAPSAPPKKHIAPKSAQHQLPEKKSASYQYHEDLLRQEQEAANKHEQLKAAREAVEIAAAKQAEQ